MSVTVVPVGTRLILRLNTGLNENMEPVFRNRTFRNIKPSASDENVHAIGEQLSSLQVHTLDSIRRLNETELET